MFPSSRFCGSRCLIAGRVAGNLNYSPVIYLLETVDIRKISWSVPDVETLTKFWTLRILGDALRVVIYYVRLARRNGVNAIVRTVVKLTRILERPNVLSDIASLPLNTTTQNGRQDTKGASSRNRTLRTFHGYRKQSEDGRA